MSCGYRGRILTPRAGRTELQYEPDGLLVVGDDGRVERVGPFRGGGLDPVVDLSPAVLLPGFVDAHVHYPQTRAIGGATGPLLEWLERTVFPEEARFADDAYARDVAAEFVDALAAAGTTTAAIFGSSFPRATEILFEALSASGLRALAGMTLMDQACPAGLRLSAADAMAAVERSADAWHGHDRGRLQVVVTPRFAISCSKHLLEAAGALAHERGLRVQTHACENVDEGAATLLAHPYGADYIDVYERAELLGPRTLLAHVVHASTREWDRIAARGAAVAHCPDSNFFLGSGRMRIVEARARGVRVALGSDVAAGRTFSMRRAMASAFDNALAVGTRLDPAELLRLSTLGGAEALGLQDVIGSLEPGKDADFVAVHVPARATTAAEVLAHVIFATDHAGVARTFVRGRCLSR